MTEELLARDGNPSASASAEPTPAVFGLIGAAGFVAPRHLKAIRDTNSRLIAAVDPHDSVGILDSYFPEARFFTEIERFDRFLEKQRRAGAGSRVQYLSVCSPNYLHDAHVRLALRLKADAICEKPLVINPWNLEQLCELEQEHQQRIWTVLQLRCHPEIKELKRRLASESATQRHEVCLSYVTRRGAWYRASWKGDEAKSGGLSMNIGVHFFDLLLWLFGSCQRSLVNCHQPARMSGTLELERARVRWFLSVDERDLPHQVRDKGGFAYRSLTMDDQEIDLSAGFTDLHTQVYRDILLGNGYGIEAARPAIDLVHNIRNSRESSTSDFAHPWLLERAWA